MNSVSMLFLPLLWYMDVNKSGKIYIYVLLPSLPVVVGIWNGVGNTEGLNSSKMLLLYRLFGKSSLLAAYYFRWFLYFLLSSWKADIIWLGMYD